LQPWREKKRRKSPFTYLGPIARWKRKQIRDLIPQSKKKRKKLLFANSKKRAGGGGKKRGKRMVAQHASVLPAGRKRKKGKGVQARLTRLSYKKKNIYRGFYFFILEKEGGKKRRPHSPMEGPPLTRKKRRKSPLNHKTKKKSG